MEIGYKVVIEDFEKLSLLLLHDNGIIKLVYSINENMFYVFHYEKVVLKTTSEKLARNSIIGIFKLE